MIPTTQALVHEPLQLRGLDLRHSGSFALQALQQATLIVLGYHALQVHHAALQMVMIWMWQ